MNVRFVAPRVPLVDLKTGLVTDPWYLFFRGLFSMGGIDNELIGLVAPTANSDVAIALADAAIGDLSVTPPPLPQSPPQDDVSPPTQIVFVALDDVLPALGALRDEVAMLRSLVDDLMKGPV